MSTIVVVRKDGIAVIGADTNGKNGYVKQRADYIKNHSKILKVNENYIATVGEGSVKQVLTSYFSKIEMKPLLNSTQEIFEVLVGLHGKLKEDYYLRPEDEDDDEFESIRFRGLIANPYGIFGFYDLRSVDEFTKFYSFGTGQEIALGAMYSLYNTNASAEEIASAGLEAACEFDDSTDRPYEIIKIKLKW